MVQPKVAEILELDPITALSAQLAAQFSAINKRFDELSAQSVQKVEVMCDLCAGNH